MNKSHSTNDVLQLRCMNSDPHSKMISATVDKNEHVIQNLSPGNEEA
jgi:hypothetical protein